MNAASLNNLWNYLEGLSLTDSNKRWLREKLSEPSYSNPRPSAADYDVSMISPRVQHIMGSVELDEKAIANDDRLAYLLNK